MEYPKVSTALLSNIVQHNEDLLGMRLSNAFCNMIEDFYDLDQKYNTQARQAGRKMRKNPKMRGKVYERYIVELSVHNLPDCVIFQNEEYNLQDIAKAYLKAIKLMEDELEKLNK